MTDPDRARVLATSRVSRETAERLDRYVAELRRWQPIKNLVGPATLAEVWSRAISRFDADTVRPHQRAWLSLTRPLGLVEDTALLAAPNEFAK